MSIQDDLNQADTLIEQGNHPAAISAYSLIIEEHPQCDEAWLILGSLFGETGETEKAIKHIEQAILLKPENGFAHLTLGHLRHATGEHDMALKALEKATKCDPENTESLCTLASLFQQGGDTQNAILNFERAVKINEELYDAWKMLGPLHFHNINLEAAENCFRRAIALNPKDHVSFIGACSLLNHLSRSNEALELLKQIPNELMNNPEVLLQIATANSKQGLHNEAMDYIDRAINIDPSDRFMLGKADVLERKGEIENVFEIIKPFLEKKPPSPAAVILFSKISDTLDLNQECLQLLETILSDDSQSDLILDQAKESRDWINSRHI